MKKIIAILVLAALLGAALFVFEPFALETYKTGIEVKVDNHDLRLGPEGLIGNIRSPGDELIQQGDDSPVVSSFRVGAEEEYYSEQITIQGSITNTGAGGLLWPKIVHSYYRIYLKTNPIMSWEEGTILDTSKGIFDKTVIYSTGSDFAAAEYHELYTPSVGDSVSMPAYSFKLIGPVVGALKVEVVTKFHDPAFTWVQWEEITSRDFMYVISGQGKAWISGYSPTDVPMYALGEKVPISYDVDYSGNTGLGTGGWELRYKPRDGRTGGLIAKLNDNSKSVYNWELPSDIWFVGITDSKVDILLYNTLFKVDGVLINTIDFRANAPPTPTVSVDDAEIYVGEGVTITGNCAVNSLTNEPITAFHVRIIYLTRNYEMGYWTTVPFTPGNPATFEWGTPGFIYDGRAKIQVWAHDNGGRESEYPAEVVIVIKSRLEGEQFLSIRDIVCIIIVLLGALVAFISPYDIKVKIIVFVIFLVIAGFVYYTVDFTPVEDWINSKWWLK